MSDQPALARRLGTTDATVIGLGSMLGAGVFAAFTPAAQAAGSGLLVGLVIAAIVAIGNATSTAQLAVAHPTSGGVFIYGRERLGPWWGFIAGWSFVVGKTASCAAMALVFASYAAPAGWERPVALLAVIAVTAVNLVGITRTALASRVILIVVLATLAVVVSSGVASGLPAFSAPLDLLSDGPYGILQSAGLLFFAFAGYARIATLGEEVRHPERVIPRAIVFALGIALVIYTAVAVVTLGTLGPDGLASSAEPLSDTVAAVGWAPAEPVVRIGASAAALGALLALVAGIGRTVLAMARYGELPRWLAAVHPRWSVPHRAEIVIGIAILALVGTTDLRGAIGFSSFGVLVYYLVANLAALTQPRAQRLFPRVLAVVGGVGCLALCATLPLLSVVLGLGVIALGVVLRSVKFIVTAHNRSGDT
ncbi:APA family basic amino acid/polyamine antiporter [Microbacteriaceae bacterium SG_E_30_P1]|uniref:APA family basic amino acid/polyamine antiporter n=1 Tax=Antiquaquibacter oligotrophicus TaxID=2880260 RepID=A0ABT6KLZ5_9MICO|nr:APC family permease [Antiquaquibacter oligotrophicus]MDH6180874.1 APA family basic amino acid/polyamine antiporter [Antiquaquibacter oligotrophicus]UDF13416.1 APC family permease [Antiquaquibacter oligotrophicus]